MLGRLSDISFKLDEHTGGLTVTIKTARLSLQSVTNADLPNYVALLGNANNMVKYGTGATYDSEKTTQRVAAWVTRWKLNDPFASLAVSLQADKTFIGHVVLGYGDRRGQSEMAYVFDEKYWQQGYGKEAVLAIVCDYAPELLKRGYLVEGARFQSVVATSRPDNLASCKILRAAGMALIKEEVKFGHLRHLFFVDTETLVAKKKAIQDKLVVAEQRQLVKNLPRQEALAHIAALKPTIIFPVLLSIFNQPAAQLESLCSSSREVVDQGKKLFNKMVAIQNSRNWFKVIDALKTNGNDGLKPTLKAFCKKANDIVVSQETVVFWTELEQWLQGWCQHVDRFAKCHGSAECQAKQDGVVIYDAEDRWLFKLVGLTKRSAADDVQVAAKAIKRQLDGLGYANEANGQVMSLALKSI